jgi:hypothetical protein
VARTIARWTSPVLTKPLARAGLRLGLLGLLAPLALLGCAETPPANTGGVDTPRPAVASSTRITAFGVSMENLNVDKVGLRDGFMKPDGNRDLAFTMTVEGPFDAVFLVSVSPKGEPVYGLRADTLTNAQEIPPELGGVIDTGKMTIGVGVVEGGRFINGESGSVHAGPGTHNLTLYVANTATLNAGANVRAYVRVEGGPLIPGPIAPY